MQFTALLSRRSGAIVLLGALVIVLGAYLSFRIARHAEPSLVPPHLVITTLSPHTSLEDMQDRVTLPQERALNGMPGLKRLQSVTRTGTSVLVAEFAPGVDRERARLGASARVVRLPIPSDAGSVEVDWGASGLTSEQPIVLLALWSTSERADVEDLTRRAREAVLPKLLAVPQVQSAVLVGDERLQVVAELDPAKMRASGVGFDQVSALVRFNSVALATGALRSQDRSTPVLTFSEPASVQALENLVVGLAQTNPFAPPTQVRLKDLAKVSITQADGAGVLRVDRGVAVGIEVYARSSGDVLQAAAAIRRAAASINGDLEELAPDVFLETFLDRTRPTARALQGLEWLMLIGATAAVVLVSLLLLSIRAGVTVAVALGTAVGAGVIIAYLGGGALTPVSAAGFALAIAFALPPTVLSTEASWRHARSGVPSPLAPWIAVREVAPGCALITLAELVCLLPLAFSTAPTGAWLRPMLLPLAATAVAGLVAALVLVPAFAQAMLGLASPGRLLGPAAWAASGVRWSLAVGTRARAVGLVVAVAVIGGSFGLLPLVPSSLLPTPATTQTIVEITTPPGATDRLVIQRLSAAESAIMAMDGVFSVVAATADAQPALNPMARRGQMRAAPDATILATFRRAAPPGHLRERLLAALEGIDGIEVRIVPVGLDEALSVFHVSVLAANASEARTEALALATELTESLGVSSVTTFPRPPQTSIAVDVNPDQALQSGVGTLQLASQVRQMLQGDRIAQIRLKDSAPVDVMLKVEPAFVNNLERLRSLPVGGGEPVALSAIASVDTIVSPIEVFREDGRSAAIVSGALLDAETRGLVNDIRAAVAAYQADSPAEVRLSGAPETRQDALRWLYPSPAISAVLVFAASALVLASLRLGIIVAVSVLLGSVGALASLVVFGRSLDLASLSGLALLPGLAVGGGVVFAEALRRVRSRGLPASDALEEAGRSASLGILLVAWPGILVLVTLATGFLDSGPYQGGQATAMAGGLVSASLLGLLVLPAVYAALHPSRERRPAPAPPTLPSSTQPVPQPGSDQTQRGDASAHQAD